MLTYDTRHEVLGRSLYSTLAATGNWMHGTTLAHKAGVAREYFVPAVRAAKFYTATTSTKALITSTDGYYIVTDDPAIIATREHQWIKDIGSRAMGSHAAAHMLAATAADKDTRKEFTIIENYLEVVYNQSRVIIG